MYSVSRHVDVHTGQHTEYVLICLHIYSCTLYVNYIILLHCAHYFIHMHIPGCTLHILQQSDLTHGFSPNSSAARAASAWRPFPALSASGKPTSPIERGCG